MEVSSVAALSTAMSQNALQQQVDVSVLKKTMELQRTIAEALISAIPPASTAGLPDNVGQTINTTA